MTRTGKIARLPRDVRNELNRRIDNGEPGTHLVAWLNGLPAVKRVLAECFEGREINDQNLSDWKTGGFQDWLALEEMLAQARHTAETSEGLVDVADAVGTDDLAAVLNLRAAAVLAEWNGEVTEAFERKIKALRRLAMVVMGLRRSQIQAGRWELEQAKYEDAIEAEIDKHELEMRRPSYEAFMRDMRRKPAPSEASTKGDGAVKAVKELKGSSVEEEKKGKPRTVKVEPAKNENIQQPTSNAQHPTLNIQRERAKVEREPKHQRNRSLISAGEP